MIRVFFQTAARGKETSLQGLGEGSWLLHVLVVVTKLVDPFLAVESKMSCPRKKTLELAQT